MKKSAFEKEFKNLIKEMPEAEQKKLLEYYDELYHDKFDNGMTEEEIVAQWGTPSDAASKILGEQAETKKEVEEQMEKISIKEKAWKYKEKAKKRVKTIFSNKTFWTIYLSLFFVTIPLTIAFFGAAFGLLAGLFSVILTLVILATVLPFSFIIGGSVGTIASFWIMSHSVGAGFASLGSSLAILALGILTLQLSKLIFGIIKKLVKKEKIDTKINWRPVLSIIAAVIFIAGCASFVGAGFSVGWNMGELDRTVYTEKSFTEFDSEMNKLNISLSTREIVIKPATNDGYKVDYHNTDNSSININYENKALTITEERQYVSFWWLGDIFSWFNRDKRVIYVYISEEITEDSSIEVTTGDVSVWDITFTGNLSAKCTTGSLRFTNIIAADMTLTGTTGNIAMSNVRANNVTVTLSTGTYNATNFITTKLNATITTGNISLNSFDAVETVLKASTGNISARFTGTKNSYDICTSVTTGNSNTSNQSNPDGKTIDAKVTTGNIHLHFA